MTTAYEPDPARWVTQHWFRFAEVDGKTLNNLTYYEAQVAYENLMMKERSPA